MRDLRFRSSPVLTSGSAHGDGSLSARLYRVQVTLSPPYGTHRPETNAILSKGRTTDARLDVSDSLPPAALPPPRRLRAGCDAASVGSPRSDLRSGEDD